MNDSSLSVAHVLGLENKRGERRQAGCLQEGCRRGNGGDTVARRGGLQPVLQKSTTGKDVTNRVFLILGNKHYLFLALRAFAIMFG